MFSLGATLSHTLEFRWFWLGWRVIVFQIEIRRMMFQLRRKE